MNYIGSLSALTVYFVIYAVTHSWLASARVKGWTRRLFGPASDRWYRLAYNLVAIVALLPMLLMMARLPSQTLYTVPAPWLWLRPGYRCGKPIPFILPAWLSSLLKPLKKPVH